MNRITLCVLGMMLSLTSYPAEKVVLIAYYSVRGHTEAMAQAAEKGVQSVDGVKAVIKSVKDVGIEDLRVCRAVIIGTPVYNGNPHPEVLKFINRWPFKDGVMKNKIGAVLVTAGGFSAGEELTSMAVIHAMMGYGMLVVGGDDWTSPLGASAIVNEIPYLTENEKGNVDKYFLNKGVSLGKRVAELAKKMN